MSGAENVQEVAFGPRSHPKQPERHHQIPAERVVVEAAAHHSVPQPHRPSHAAPSEPHSTLLVPQSVRPLPVSGAGSPIPPPPVTPLGTVKPAGQPSGQGYQNPRYYSPHQPYATTAPSPVPVIQQPPRQYRDVVPTFTPTSPGYSTASSYFPEHSGPQQQPRRFQQQPKQHPPTTSQPRPVGPRRTSPKKWPGFTSLDEQPVLMYDESVLSPALRRLRDIQQAEVELQAERLVDEINRTVVRRHCGSYL